jgi:hypothetical protein
MAKRDESLRIFSSSTLTNEHYRQRVLRQQRSRRARPWLACGEGRLQDLARTEKLCRFSMYIEEQGRHESREATEERGDSCA